MVNLRRLGSRTESAPLGCETSARVPEATCAHLAKKGLKNPGGYTCDYLRD